MILIHNIQKIKRTTEKLHPKAKYLFSFKVSLDRNKSKYELYGLVYDRPHTGSENYGLIKIDTQDITEGNIQNISKFKEETSQNVYGLVIKEVMSILYNRDNKEFPIIIKEKSS